MKHLSKGMMMKSIVATMGLLLGASQLSCSVNDYCLNCGHLDGGGGDDGDANDGGGSGTDAMPDVICIPSGIEICDDIDNDCNGLIDDGTVSGTGESCAAHSLPSVGACAGGVTVCDSATKTIRCDPAHRPTPEVCDNIDNDCNGVVDNGDPGGGANCTQPPGMYPPKTGTCIPPVKHCVNGTIQCTGGVDHRNDPEQCNGADDNCNDLIDDGIPSGGACGNIALDGIGICKAGSLSCVGGNIVCTGSVYPQFETCNGVDDDCANGIDDPYDTQTDPNNCGGCIGMGGQKCTPKSMTCINSATRGLTCTMDSDCDGSDPNKKCVVNSVPACKTGGCTFNCNAGFVDLDKQAANGCEYKCTKTSNTDSCDGDDNDCDGIVDENAAGSEPNICKQGGACGTVVAQCSGKAGWTCSYTNMTCQGGTAGANTGANCTSSTTCTNGGTCVLAPTEFPEELSCDDIDNDCDTLVDESHKPDQAGNVKGLACNDGEPGVCLDTGTWACDKTTALTEKGNLVCSIPAAGHNPDLPRTGIDEDCNGKDDDCDGKTDEQIKPALHGQDWVDIGGGKKMMAYEASRPDAATTNIGSSIACSRTDVLPWTNVTYPTARDMCAALKFCVGGTSDGSTCTVAGDCPGGACSAQAHLCSEVDWHHTCSAVAFPAATTNVANAGSYIEAEDYTSVTTGTVPVGAETGTGQCGNGSTLNSVDEDGDGLINDGCPAQGTAESGANCLDSNDNDGDNYVNDGCPVNTQKTRAWTEDYVSIPGVITTFGTWTGISDMQATANTGASMLTGAQAVAQGPSMTYSLNFTATGTYHVWLRMYAPATKDDMVWVSLGASPPTAQATATTSGSPIPWAWVDTNATFVIGATGAKTLTIWMGDDGARIDRIFIGTSASAPPDPTGVCTGGTNNGTVCANNSVCTGGGTCTARAVVDATHGGTWAFSSPASPNTYGTDVCNGDDHDTSASPGDQDDVLTTASFKSTTCAALQNSNKVFDMSGNVKEWVLAHSSGENPIRGGASDSSAAGLTCALNFTLADDAFLLPNIGFRCCR